VLVDDVAALDVAPDRKPFRELLPAVASLGKEGKVLAKLLDAVVFVDVKRILPGLYAVPSATDPGKQHLVQKTEAGLVCSCQAARHGRKCRHVRKVEELERWIREQWR
jgi:hypothetical protein